MVWKKITNLKWKTKRVLVIDKKFNRYVKETEMQFVSNFIAEHDKFRNECSENKPDILNYVFTEVKMRLCISNLPDGKSGGVDGILNEMLKCTNDIIITPLLTLLFNKILLTGEYPNMWWRLLSVRFKKKW